MWPVTAPRAAVGVVVVVPAWVVGLAVSPVQPLTSRATPIVTARPARVRGHPQAWPIQAGHGILHDAMSCRRIPTSRPTRWVCGSGTLPHRHAEVLPTQPPLGGLSHGTNCRSADRSQPAM